eukprot:scaffold126060_cov57-Phaeocystis_antarctica.AAC.2
MPLVTDLRPDEVPAFMSRGFRVENMSNCSIVSSMCVTCSGRGCEGVGAQVSASECTCAGLAAGCIAGW